MSKLRYVLAVSTICLALPGCDRNKSGAEDAVLETLKDPDSARFGDFYYNPETKRGCLTVNAKNSMGGFTGDQQAYVMNMDGKWASLFIEDTSQDICRQAHADSGD